MSTSNIFEKIAFVLMYPFAKVYNIYPATLDSNLELVEHKAKYNIIFKIIVLIYFPFWLLGNIFWLLSFLSSRARARRRFINRYKYEKHHMKAQEYEQAVNMFNKCRLDIFADEQKLTNLNYQYNNILNSTSDSFIFKSDMLNKITNDIKQTNYKLIETRSKLIFSEVKQKQLIEHLNLTNKQLNLLARSFTDYTSDINFLVYDNYSYI